VSLPPPPWTIGVRQLIKREYAAFVISLHRLRRHAVQQAQVVLLFCFFQAPLPEWACWAMAVENQRRRLSGQLFDPFSKDINDWADCPILGM